MNSEMSLAQLFAERGTLLLDFDGPVCSIFANHPAPQVADALRKFLDSDGVELPSALRAERDPLELLRWTGTLGRAELVRRVEARLRAEEVSASKTAEPTPYAHEVIIAALQAGESVAIVSNNSAEAISAFLSRQGLEQYNIAVFGREFGQPDRMKPNPAPIFRAVKSLDTSVDDCVLVGDSLADIHAANAAEIPVIGYANRQAKEGAFRTAKADVIVTSMAEIADALTELASRRE
jgi:HAD superfamily hydrolase (TIGR01549 family)